MLIRLIDGTIVIIKRSNFSSDVSYHKKIYENMYPFINKYSGSFLLLEKGELLLEKGSNYRKK